MKITTSVTLLLTAITVLLSSVATIAKADDNDKGSSKNAQKVNKQDDGLQADPHPAPCLSWIDQQTKPKVALLCIHGLGLNSDAYKNFGNRMAHRGIATYAIDVRGFGSWMRAKGNEQVNFGQ